METNTRYTLRVLSHYNPTIGIPTGIADYENGNQDDAETRKHDTIQDLFWSVRENRHRYENPALVTVEEMEEWFKNHGMSFHIFPTPPLTWDQATMDHQEGYPNQ